jgi:hypothetical protein
MRSNGATCRLAISLATIILFAGCAAGTTTTTPATASSPPITATPAPAATPGPAATPLPEPTPIVTPLASPKPPGVADLVVRLTWDSDVVVSIPGTTIVGDGRVIWGLGGAIVERQLTDEGLAWVRARLDETGLFHANGSYGATLKPGATPDPRGATLYAFRTESTGTHVKVVSGDPDDAAPPEAWVIPPEVQVLADLAHRLQDPEAWIETAMWAGPAEPFNAHAYLVIIDLAPGQPAFGHYPENNVAWPFADPITQVGGSFRQGGRIVENQRCLAASAELARAMADAEAAVGRSRDLDGWMVDLGYGWGGADDNVVVTTNPLLPYQSRDCTDALAW